jgi:hypothetical protein
MKSAVMAGLLVAAILALAGEARAGGALFGNSEKKKDAPSQLEAVSWSGPAFKKILTGSPTGTESGGDAVPVEKPPSPPAEGVSWSEAAYWRMFSITSTGGETGDKGGVASGRPPMPPPLDSATKSIDTEKQDRKEPPATAVSPSMFIEAKPPEVPKKPAEVPVPAVAISRSASGVATAKPEAAIPNKGSTTPLEEASREKKQPVPVAKAAPPAGKIIVVGKVEKPVVAKTVTVVPVPVKSEKVEWLVVSAGEPQPERMQKVSPPKDLPEQVATPFRVGEKKSAQEEERGDYDRALEYYEKRLYEYAISLLDGLLEKGKKDGNEDWRALELMGRCMNEMGKPVSALLYCRRSLELNPANSGLQALVAEMEGRVTSWSRYE